MQDALMAVVLAAGKGTRLQSEQSQLPKVLRRANGQPLLHWVLEALSFIPRQDIVVVAGFMKEAVMEAFPNCRFAVQEPQLGTGHAVLCAQDALRGFDGTVLVCYGDMPLLRRETYLALLEEHRNSGAACTLLSGRSDKPLAYGRVLRDDEGNFLAVVEDRDCTPEQKQIPELNCGIYAFDCRKLLGALTRLRPDNAQGEYYLTDVPALLRADGERVRVCSRQLNEELLGVNTPEQLAEAEAFLRQR